MKEKTMQRVIRKIILLPALVLMLSTASHAIESRFRVDFTESYRANRFAALGYLVMQNKTMVPAEVRGIVKEALAEGTSFSERMDLLDLASAMASVYRDKHNDATLADMVLAVQQKEVKKERARKAELNKWDKYEKITGNIVLKTNEAKMAEAGLTPVIYPHWVHRLYYDCKTCHQSIFKPKRGENEINMMGIFTGKKCGVCHDGKTAFSPYDDCTKCHSAGKPGAEKFMDAAALDLNKVVETATRLGAVWRPERLDGHALPLDRFKTVDWTRLERTGAREPVKTQNAEELSDAAKPHASSIIFDPKFDFVKRVPFDHKNHSAKLNCSTCHQRIFSDRLAGNKLSMKEMSTGKYCGACHGKVAFKLAECNRCHSLDRFAPIPPGAITRKQSAEQTESIN